MNQIFFKWLWRDKAMVKYRGIGQYCGTDEEISTKAIISKNLIKSIII